MPAGTVLSSELSSSVKSLLLQYLDDVTAGDASSDLTAVQRDFFTWHEQQAPEFATDVGTKAYNDRLADLSFDVFDTRFVIIACLTLFIMAELLYLYTVEFSNVMLRRVMYVQMYNVPCNSFFILRCFPCCSIGIVVPPPL